MHGLGLLLVTLMAGTGALWWWLEPAGIARTIEEIHKLLPTSPRPT
ncbi:MAG: hypothetical protein ACK4S2_06095 [Gemmobacter sp.]